MSFGPHLRCAELIFLINSWYSDINSCRSFAAAPGSGELFGAMRHSRIVPPFVLAMQLQAARHHAPEQLTEHVNVEIRANVFESLTRSPHGGM